MPVYLTPTDIECRIECRIEGLKTGEIPDAGEVVKDYYSPIDFYGMFPELLCEHGVNKLVCYPCAPFPTKNPNMPEDVRQIEQEYFELY